MGFIDYEVDGQVGIITINRPKALNALNSEVLKDLDNVSRAYSNYNKLCFLNSKLNTNYINIYITYNYFYCYSIFYNK